MKQYQLLVEVDSVLLALWKLFEYSPQMFAMLYDVQQAYVLKSFDTDKSSNYRVAN